MGLKLNIFICLVFLFSCSNAQKEEAQKVESDPIAKLDSLLKQKQKSNEEVTFQTLKTEGSTIQARFNVPKGFSRVQTDSLSYAFYLQNLPLKANGSPVLLFNGTEKYNQGVHEAVIDLKIGSKDLHQCADAIMRLRAEYLWNAKKYDQIHFNFTNGFRVDYANWMNGQRIVVNGNKTSWRQKTSPSNTYNDFWKYMEIIFSYAGTLSLSKELQPVAIDSIQIGDMFIQGGSPGHAIVVVDMAINKETGEKLMMLAQSYMPAQETHILKNHRNKAMSPWYSTSFTQSLVTPEWLFIETDLKRFKE